jgi:hypothetical protein
LPWDDRFPKAVEATLSLTQSAVGATGGGRGPFAPLGMVTDELSKPGGALSDPVTARALSMIGVPASAFAEIGENLPGLGAHAPGVEAANAVAAAIGAGSGGTATPNALGAAPISAAMGGASGQPVVGAKGWPGGGSAPGYGRGASPVPMVASGLAPGAAARAVPPSPPGAAAPRRRVRVTQIG